METVFITIHDLSLDARIKYVSDSIEDTLGYLPHEVKGKSCWEYFHPDEIPFARAIHGRGLKLDKAAVLRYCQIKHKDGSWIGCECVFTVVYDVLIASTSIYKRGARSHQRALDGAEIRRIFSSSPRDPRYHMLSYLSKKFYQDPRLYTHEPRAALFLNRFTRTSTIMFSTNGVATILGIRPEQLMFESAKANDSIAYLRFWYRNPLQEESFVQEEPAPNGHVSEDEDNDEEGVAIKAEQAPDTSSATAERPVTSTVVAENGSADGVSSNRPSIAVKREISGNSSVNDTEFDGDAADAIFDPPTLDRSSSSLTPVEDPLDAGGSIEIEAVVSCTSDGLVVILRRARPLVPLEFGTTEAQRCTNGLFASPWATEAILPPDAPSVIPPEAAAPRGTEPEPAGFMKAIRDVAVFAWSLTGINGSLAQFGEGSPSGEALPPGGFPVWDPNANASPEMNQYNGFMTGSHRPIEDSSPDAKQGKKEADATSSSEDEVLWKRVPTIPAFRKPVRRGHDDAFGSDDDDKAQEAEDRGLQSKRRRVGNR